MKKKDVLKICSDMLDTITTLKGFAQLNKENKKIDYSIIMMQELNNFEQMINKIVDHFIDKD